MNKILIVDDEREVITELERLLSNYGYVCTVAGDAAEAKELMVLHEYDLMISELHMPGSARFDLTQYAKKEFPAMAQVVMSAKNEPEIAQMFLKAGIYGFILKPFSIHQMLITVQNALIRRNLEFETEQMRQNLETLVREQTAALDTTLADLKKEQAKSAATVRQLSDQMLLVDTLLDAIPSPIFYKDAAGRYQKVNKAFEESLGLANNQIIGKTIWDIAPPDRAQIHADTEAGMLEGRDDHRYEAQARFSDGTLHDVLFNKAAVRNSEGRIEGIVCVMIDITEHKARETALRRSEEKMRQILDNIGIGVAVLSPEMRLLEANRKMRQWFPAAAKGDKPFCYTALNNPPLNTSCAQCPTIMALEDGQVHEATLTRMDGLEHRTLRIISSPIHDDHGQVSAAIELVEDITEKIIMERELMQSAKMASIGQLAAGVAHEINNPTGFVSSNLNTLNGYVEDLNGLVAAYQGLKKAVAADFAPGTELHDLLEKIETIEGEIDLDFIRQDMGDLIHDCRQGTDRIKKIVEDLKHFAHPGQDKVQDTDINKELETTLSVVRNELKYKATVIQELGELPIVKANPQQLNQVFVNILVNAAQAIDQMGEIRIKTHTMDGFARIEISDTGCGIAPEHLGKIFEPFFTTKEVGKGTGLGMNIAYNIIKKHRGVIDVDSEVGRGTTFTINLPLERSVVA